MIVLGLTGGPGNGKSLAASYFKELGAIILSGDQAGRKAVDDYPSILKKLVNEFGKSILKYDGTLNRSVLGHKVFGNPISLQRLNEIVHPRLLKILKADLAKFRKAPRLNLIVIDAALIFEWGIADWCDYILVVTARQDIRIKRLMASGLFRRHAENRIASQIPDEDKAALADFVIENNSTKANLNNKIRKLVKDLSQDDFPS